MNIDSVIKMIDTHIHADARSGEDFRQMYLAGIDCAITCSYYPYKIPQDIILLNHLNRILEFDTKRAMTTARRLTNRPPKGKHREHQSGAGQTAR